MTCVAAYAAPDGSCAIACDTELGWAHHRYTVATKVFAVPDGWLVASAGASRWQRFARELAEPVPTPEAFADLWLAWARERGHGETHELTHHQAGSWLLARRGLDGPELYVVGGDGGVDRPMQAYVAIGSGAEVALGAMHALVPSGPAERVVEAAVRAAVFHSPGCGGPVRVHNL